MDEALVQNAQHDVNHQNGHDQQDGQSLERLLEFLHRALEVDADGGRYAQFLQRLFYVPGRLAQGLAGFKVKEQGTRGSCPKRVTAGGPAARESFTTVSSGVSAPPDERR